ncbi:hypothetical protein FNF27_02169 [Cafeteria roenbergensis]|uniref:Saposin B-type domain-containing protein n=1 Tax=Cafeteria roenbergensis TaxID=33653 RepID=A0A5A8EF20_CAFRO|nr:hypothetical protein FNF29_01729 [Cafeteria roenbergensis]KAA0176473.1 hypothetical protein FNF27_02169 [Cafeteria roenbergensis]|eukprot:KAA0155354.1 hypothetical protein FNF29_01729 [Cafeteria roenbergensis]
MLAVLALAAAALVAPAAAHAAGFHSLASDALIEQVHQTQNDTDLVLLQTQASVSAQRVQGYCEICVRMIQMKQRFQPDVCSGLTDNFFITCVKNLESIIKADRAVSYWHNVGCVHLDAAGPEAVKPCPAHVICGWTPNIFGQRIRADGETMGQLAPLCPRDTNFVPRVPRTDAPAELPFDFSKLSK